MTLDGPRFGYTIPQRGLHFGVMGVPDLLGLATEADRSGAFGSVWVGDSLLSKPRPDSLSLLGALLAVTERVKLGVGCMASFPLRDPVVFAYQWASLDMLSAGRMLLAACTGIVKAGSGSAKEGQTWGVPDGQRAARMDEYIEVCRRLWSERDVSFEGRFTSFEHVTLEPRPVQAPPPIWIAANPRPGRFYERSLRRVARLGDGWMSVRLRPGMLGDAWAALQGYLVEEGRDPGTFPVLAYHNVNINEDRQAALDETERFIGEYYGPNFSPEQVEAWTVAGSPKQCAEELQELIAEGADHVTLRATSWDQRAQLHRLLEEVLPEV